MRGSPLLLDWAPGILLAASAIVVLGQGAGTPALIIGMCSGFCLGIATTKQLRP